MKKLICFYFFCFLVHFAGAQELKYSSCDNCWNADSLGNHRAVVQVSGEEVVAKVMIPWRRRDRDAKEKRIIVEDAKSHRKVLNVKAETVNREYGIIYFEPISGKGIYFVYYMPYKNEGRSNYPKGVYLKPESTASSSWLNAIRPSSAADAFVKEIQAINTFNSFYPMEVVATDKEMRAVKEQNKNKAFLIFPEDRQRSIRMEHDLPYHWIKKGPLSTFSGESARGENYAYQLGIYALQNLDDVQVQFSDLRSANGKRIAAKNSLCINMGGTTYDAKPFVKRVDVPEGAVQALWCTVDVPQDAVPGTYTGKAIVTAKGQEPSVVVIRLRVTSQLLKDGGVNELSKMTRLKWLNSTLAQENEVVAPYTPLEVKDNTIRLLGRKFEVNNDGFPKQIQTFFTPEMTGYTKTPNNLFTQPAHFHVTGTDGKDLQWKKTSLQWIKKGAGTVQWRVINVNKALRMEVAASLEFDGFTSYTVKFTALHDVQLKDISFHLPFTKESARYMIGLGHKGGYLPEGFEWKWDVAHKNQDGAWVGNVNAGLQFSLRDEKYVRPLNTNFYLQKPLLLPSSWGNENKGGITIGEKETSILVNSYSGERSLKKGDTLYYNFTLLITPFHPIHTDFQWATRFYHKYDDLDSIKGKGATVVNIHHATPINPWINYPFIEWKKMKAYVDEAHHKGLKVKIYNTVRELSNHAYETFALRSLGHEIYSPGNGGGFSWLQEHIDSDYIAAWFVPEIKDAALVNSGMSRWHNYYVEGMNWLVNRVGIDGIYLDDVAFDRVTMKRIKRVLTQKGHPGIIDLHSANQYNKNDGFNNSANLYMEHFPYLSRIWFGEYFDYENNTPDFFLTEVSGIPFGLMGEMLQGGGNPWRGMIYGMTNRMPWSDNADPRPIWKVWDAFGMQGTEMIGYWSTNCPVKTDNEKVLATAYQKKGATLLSIASWADSNVNVQLKIDWKSLGLDPSKATVTAPEIKGFQPQKDIQPGESLLVEKGKGWLLIIR
jgi:hypothetical protein